MSRDLALEAALSPVVVGLGYDFVRLEYVGGSGKYSVLRVFINKPGGVSLNDCEKVSRQLSAVLDVESELIRGAYTLEVSSPGVE